MKNTNYILIFLILSTGTLFSQNGKVWEFDVEPIVIRDLEFINENSFVELDEYEGYNLVILDIEVQTPVEGPIQFDFYPAWDVEVAKEQELIFVASADEIYFYDFNLQLVDSFKVEEFEAEGGFKTTLINLFAINPENNRIAISQSKTKEEGGELERILIYNYKNEELLEIIETENNFMDIKYTNDGKYLILPERANPANIKFYDASTNEHLFDIQKEEIEDYTLMNSRLHISWNSRFVSAIYLSGDIFVYDVETESSYNFRLDEFFFQPYQTTFIDNEHLLIVGRNEEQEEIGIVFSFPELDSIYTLPPTMGTRDVKFDPETNLILSYDQNLINLSRFAPNPNSVKNSTNETNYKLYPNPVIDKATLEFEMDKAGQYSYYISDNTGRIIKQYDKEYFDSGTNRLNIDLSSFQIGVYYLHFNPTVGKVFKVIKVE